jgi:hypothetical protein
MAGFTAGTMLAANQPQSPKGTSVNASMTLGLGVPGNELEGQLKDQEEERRKKLLGDMNGSTPSDYGANLLSASGQIFGTTR